MTQAIEESDDQPAERAGGARRGLERERRRQQVRILRHAPPGEQADHGEDGEGARAADDALGEQDDDRAAAGAGDQHEGEPLVYEAMKQKGCVAANDEQPGDGDEAGRQAASHRPPPDGTVQRVVHPPRVEDEKDRRQKSRARHGEHADQDRRRAPPGPGRIRRPPSPARTRPEAMAPKLAPRKNGVTTDDSAKAAPNRRRPVSARVGSRNTNPAPRSTIPAAARAIGR